MVWRPPKGVLVFLGLGVAGVPFLVLVTIGLGLLTWGVTSAYGQRKEEQIAAGLEPKVGLTIVVAVLDMLGVGGLVEGVTMKRLITGTHLDPEAAGGAFGSGLVQLGTILFGGRVISKVIRRVPITARMAECIELANLAKRQGFTGVTPLRLLRVIQKLGRAERYQSVVAQLPAWAQANLAFSLENGYIAWSDDMSLVLRGPGGTFNVEKVEGMVQRGESKRIRNTFNQLRGGEAQLKVRDSIVNRRTKDGQGFKRVVADVENPSKKGLDFIFEAVGGIFEITEFKLRGRFGGKVGAHKVSKVLKKGPDGWSIKKEDFLSAISEKVKKGHQSHPISSSRLHGGSWTREGRLRAHLQDDSPNIRIRLLSFLR